MDTVKKTCIYCGHQVIDATIVPGLDDDAYWAKLAKEHTPDCEWINTKAHRINVEKYLI